MKNVTGHFKVEQVAGKNVREHPAAPGNVDWDKVPYNFRQFDTLAEARESSDWKEDATLLALINGSEKQTARANEYQTVTAFARPDQMSAEDRKDSAIKNLIKLGVPRDIAEQQVDAMLAATVA